MKVIFILYFFIFLTILGLLVVLASGKMDFSLEYQTADRESTHIAPDLKTTPEAVIQVYSARAFNWRGLFSVHTWLSVKPKNADHYIVYQVVGWRKFRGLSPVMHQPDLPDRSWFGQTPKVILDIRGEKAEQLIQKINAAVTSYPYPMSYQLWPGPNSNTFTAYVGRLVPELGLVMPANAIGKDYLGADTFFARAPSGTGYQISLWGVLGILIAKREGLEINLFGLVFGVSPGDVALKIPCIGTIGPTLSFS